MLFRRIDSQSAWTVRNANCNSNGMPWHGSKLLEALLNLVLAYKSAFERAVSEAQDIRNHHSRVTQVDLISFVRSCPERTLVHSRGPIDSPRELRSATPAWGRRYNDRLMPFMQPETWQPMRRRRAPRSMNLFEIRNCETKSEGPRSQSFFSYLRGVAIPIDSVAEQSSHSRRGSVRPELLRLSKPRSPGSLVQARD